MESVQLTLQLGPGGIALCVFTLIALTVSYMVYRNTIS